MRAFIGLSILFLLICGCSQRYEEPKPTTHKVEGKIVYKSGKGYDKGGTIEFLHDTLPGATSSGAIKSDGTFELQTSTAQHKLKGALEGPHRVTIIPDSPDQSILPIVLQKKYTIVAGDNNLTIIADN